MSVNLSIVSIDEALKVYIFLWFPDEGLSEFGIDGAVCSGSRWR